MILPKPSHLRVTLCGLALLSSITACRSDKAPDMPVVQSEPAPPPAPAVARSRLLDGLAWTFGAQGRCIATASGKGIAVSVEVTDSRVEWRIQGRSIQRSRIVPSILRFSSSTASWTVSARRTSAGQLVVSEPLSENQVARIVVVLGGTTIAVGPIGRAAMVRIPEAGQNGTTWFRCVRNHLLP